MTALNIDEVRAALPSGYTVESFLDQGGQGTVFRGTWNGQVSAIKVFSPTSEARRIERELKCLKEITCENLVRLLDTTVIPIGGVDHYVLAYEFLSGGDLKSKIRGAASTEAEIRSLAKCISVAINELWKRRIVHRDIKPANIMCETGSRYVLVDVGLARHVDRSDITAPGLVAGTVMYMSPEQLRGQRALTISSDLFALGITVYEFATKVHPFGRSYYRPGISVVPVAKHRPDLPVDLCKVIDALLSVKPANRPNNIETRI